MAEPRTKRLRMAVDDSYSALKFKILLSIYKVGNYILEKVLTAANDPSLRINLSVTNQVGGATYSVIDFIGRVRNTSQLQIDQISQTIKISYSVQEDAMRTRKEFTYSVKTLIEEIEANKFFDIPIGTEQKKIYFETMMHLIELLNLFPLRFNEVRLGQSVYFESSNAQKRSPVSDFGLGPEFAHLLEGITYPPERKSSLLQSLGPLTVMISLIKEDNVVYREKYKSALTNAISYVPGHEEIVEYFSNNQRRSSPEICRALGSVLLLSGDCHSHRIAIPFGVFLCYVKTYTTPQNLDQIHIPYDTTGKGAYGLVKFFQDNKWTMYWSGDAAVVPQVVFHAIMGSMSSSFDLLSKITNCNQWMTRQRVGGAFKGRASGSSLMFEPIKIIYAKKMITSAQNTLLAAGRGNNTCCEPFSGRYVKHYPKEELDFSKKGVGGPGIVLGLKGTAMIQYMQDVKNNLERKIEENSHKIEHGTTSWQRLDDFLAGNEITVSLNIVSTGKNFLTTEKISS